MSALPWMSCALVLALVPAATRPAEPTEEPSGEIVLEEIELKSRRAPLVDTLEVREVRETSARDLGEALEQQLGLGKVRKAGIANDVVLRGLKRDDVTVVVDGAHLHGACPSRMDPPSSHLDYAEVAHVEVKRGPFDVTQPGGLGGVIDVRTRAPRSGGFGSELNVGTGSSGALETSGVVSYAGAGGDVLLGGAFKQAEPFRSGNGLNVTRAVPATVNGAPNPARYRNTSSDQVAYDVRSGWAKVGLAPAAGHRLELAYARQSSTDVLYPYLLMDGIRDDTDRVNATWSTGAAGPFSRALAQAYWSRVEHDMTDEDRCSSAANPGECTGALPRGFGMRTLAQSSVAGGKVEAVLGGERAGVTLGADTYFRRWDGTTTRVNRMAPGMPYASEASIPDVAIDDVGLYVEARRPLTDRLRVLGGARVDVAASEARADRTSVYRTFHPGSDRRSTTEALLAGNVQLEVELGSRTLLFVGYGHGSRLPDPQERWFALTGMPGKPAWVGDPSLDPVRTEEVDASVKWTFARALVKAHAFHAWIADYITLGDVTVTPEGGTPLTAKTYRSVTARTYGGEASARVALPLDLYASASVSYTEGENETDGVPLAEMPPLRASVTLRHDVGRFFAEAEEQWAAPQDRVDRSLGETHTGGWAITNLRVGVEWSGLKAFAGVRNLFDRQYHEHLGYLRDPYATGTRVPEPGRTLYSNVQYAF